ncbi:DNA-J related domain-containing protein [Psychromonas sp. KJ10-10]|uniref:DNA-J related domain-containing protein n=1 Tax=Psychromonas sp. KJ10-10 TaxID=3391823 RepID=UPI0039B37CA8
MLQVKVNSCSDESIDNPLIWPLLTLLKASPENNKIHHLASELQHQGLLPDLDIDADKALFKRNFLLMNALYQLQEMLLPEYWLQIQALDIQLSMQLPIDLQLELDTDISLRQYYLNWEHFETSAQEVESLLSQFWHKYGRALGNAGTEMDKSHAFQVFELDKNASQQVIRRQWRKLALKWHPDRDSGDAVKFRLVCEAWQILKRNTN